MLINTKLWDNIQPIRITAKKNVLLFNKINVYNNDVIPALYSKCLCLLVCLR